MIGFPHKVSFDALQKLILETGPFFEAALDVRFRMTGSPVTRQTPSVVLAGHGTLGEPSGVLDLGQANHP